MRKAADILSISVVPLAILFVIKHTILVILGLTFAQFFGQSFFLLLRAIFQLPHRLIAARRWRSPSTKLHSRRRWVSIFIFKGLSLREYLGSFSGNKLRTVILIIITCTSKTPNRLADAAPTSIMLRHSL